MQAGTSDQGTIHIGLAHERGGIIRFHAAAILNRKRSSTFLAELFANSAANRGVRLLSLVRRGVLPGTDGPNRFIGNDELAHAFGVDFRQTTPELCVEHSFRSVGL